MASALARLLPVLPRLPSPCPWLRLSVRRASRPIDIFKGRSLTSRRFARRRATDRGDGSRGDGKQRAGEMCAGAPDTQRRSTVHVQGKVRTQADLHRPLTFRSPRRSRAGGLRVPSKPTQTSRGTWGCTYVVIRFFASAISRANLSLRICPKIRSGDGYHVSLSQRPSSLTMTGGVHGIHRTSSRPTTGSIACQEQTGRPHNSQHRHVSASHNQQVPNDSILRCLAGRLITTPTSI